MASPLISLTILFTEIGVLIGWLFDGLGALTFVLSVLIVADYISNIMRGIINKELCSVVSIKKIFQKILILLLVVVANIIDTYLIRSDNAPLKTTITIFYSINQGISLLENATAIGLPVPKVLKDTLVKMQKEKEE